MTPTELLGTLDKHEKWLNGVQGGIPADLTLQNMLGYALPRVDLRRAKLTGADFGECDLSNADFREADLFGANFQNADLSNANFAGANMRGIMLSGANLARACLTDADLREGALLHSTKKGEPTIVRVDLAKLEVEQANLSGADLSGARLADSAIVQSDLSDCILRGCDFTNANLSLSNLENADLSDAILTNADMSGVSLIGANMSGASIEGANLSNANLSDANLYGLDLAAANLDGATLRREMESVPVSIRDALTDHQDWIASHGAEGARAQLPDVDLNHLDLSETNLSGADLSGANLEGASLAHCLFVMADLSNANLKDADLDCADLSGANLSRSDLSGANFRKAILDAADILDEHGHKTGRTWPCNMTAVNAHGTRFKNGSLRGAKLTNADLSQANLSAADLTDADLSKADLEGKNFPSDRCAMFRSRGRGHRLSAASRLRRLARLGAFLLLALAGAYAPTTPADASSDEGSIIEGVLYYTRYDDHPSVKSVPYRYDGERFELGTAQPVASTHGADGILFAPDGDLIVGGQGERVHKIRMDGSGDHKTLRLDGTNSFHVSLDPTGRYLWSFGLPGTLAKIPLSPFGGATSHPLSGDDLEITHIVFDAEGRAYYTASGFDGHGSFGRIDLERFETHRLIERLEAAHGMTFDGFTGNLILFGGNEVAQIDPAAPSEIVSRITVATTSQFDQGTADGAGHLFAARNDGTLLFVDYAASGRIGDPSNVTATVFVDTHLDDVAPLSGPGADPAILAESSAAPEGYPSSGEEDSAPFPASLALIGGALLLLAAATLVALWLMPVLGTVTALGLALAASAMAAHQAVLLYRTLTGQLFPPPDGMSSGLALAAGAALVVALFLPLRRRPSAASELDRLNAATLGGEVEIDRDETSWKEDWSGAKLLLDGLRRSNVEDVAGYLRDHPELIDMALEATRRLDPIGPDGDPPSRPDTPPEGGIPLDATAQARFFADLLASLAQGGIRTEVERAHWDRTDTQSVTRIACSIPAQHAEDWALVLLTMLRRRTRKSDVEGARDALPLPGPRTDDGNGRQSKPQGSRMRLGPIGLLTRKTRAATRSRGGEAAPVDPFADRASHKTLHRKVVDIGVILHKVARRETDAVSGEPPAVAVSGDLSAYADPKLVKTLMRDLVRHAMERAGGAVGTAIEMAKPPNGKDDGVVMRVTGAELDWTDDALAKAREIIQQHGGRFWSEKTDHGLALNFALEPASRSAGQTAPSRWQMVSG